MNNNEIWKSIAGLEGRYQISNKGSVRSVDRIIIDVRGRKRFFKGVNIIPRNGKSGYSYFSVRYPGNSRKCVIKIHRAVATAFIPNTENKPCVNHINSITTDNNVDNLEWCTFKENRDHAVLSGNLKMFGEDNKSSKLKDLEVIEILKLKGKYSASKIGRMYGVTHRTILNIHNGISRKYLTNKNEENY